VNVRTSFHLPDLSLSDAALHEGRDLAAGFASTLCQIHLQRGGAKDDEALLARIGFLLSLLSADGHACVPHQELATRISAHVPVDHDTVVRVLTTSPAVANGGSSQIDTPECIVINDLGRLYLQRYWRYEVLLSRRLRGIDQAAPLADTGTLQQLLGRFFPARNATGSSPDWQKIAAATALTRRLAIITGGPGTGKTHTAARLLAMIAELAPESRIALAAPTGKAALRLEQLLRQQIEQLALGHDGDADSPATKSLCQLKTLRAQTVHRLLGGRPGALRPRFNRQAALPFDVVMIDEASMLDLALASKLLEALRPDARLILLGDAEQLASVETGAVFAELASLSQRDAAFSLQLGALCQQPPEFLADVAAKPGAPLGNAVVRLHHSFRYDSRGAIAALADAVRMGQSERAESLAMAGEGGVRWRSLAGVADADALALLLVAGYAPLLDAIEKVRPAEEVLAMLSRYTVLCGLRRGPFGAERLNLAMARLISRQLAALQRDGWFHGRVVMVTQNDPVQKLFNGDVGIALLVGDTLMVHFAHQASVRQIAVARLPTCETAFALTVHKSQGSEFDMLDVILPPLHSPLATRELVYTGVTRARQQVTLWGEPLALADAVANPSLRYSALGDRVRADA
jgi:exodeoxyribonuclease V alpha subunit